jgi:hypothetical protein
MKNLILSLIFSDGRSFEVAFDKKPILLIAVYKKLFSVQKIDAYFPLYTYKKK